MQSARNRPPILILAALVHGLFVTTGGSTEAEPLLNWAKQYNAPSPSMDQFIDFAVDSSGNAYVASFNDSADEGRNWTTAKFGPQGALVWEAHFLGPTRGYTGVSALAVDAQSNVYVIGYREGDFARTDMTTVKYDPDGNELWVARYHGLLEGADNRGFALALDDEGNVYVAGFSTDEHADSGYWNYKYTTIKYDPDGNELWVALYDGPSGGHPFDYATEITLDHWGNVIVTGQVDSDFLDDLATVKYDPYGNELWATLYAGPEDIDDRPTDLAADASGCICVTVDTGYRTSTIKYDPDGNTLWVARHPDLHQANALAVDQNENVYVAGRVVEGSTDYLALVKYDSNGSQLWEALYDEGPQSQSTTSEVGYDVVVDGTGHAYVAGRTHTEDASPDYLTLKVDPDGNLLWATHYDGPSHLTDVANQIALDPAGNPLVAGNTTVRYRYNDDISVLKYDQDGNQLWVAQYDGPQVEGIDTEDRASSIVADDEGNVYVCGASENLDENLDYRTIKYDAGGNSLWIARYDGSGHGADEPVSLHVDTLGNVYTSGSSEGAGTGWDYATVKYGPEGNQLWITRYEGSAYGMGSRASDMAVDALGNVYVTGSSDTISTSRDYTTVKIDPNGNMLWEARYDGPAGNTDEAAAVAVDETGSIYVTGRSNDGEYGYATVKYDTGGNELWVARYEGSGCDPTSLALNASGSVYITGSCLGIDKDYVTVKYDGQGNELWAARFNGPGNGEDLARDLALTAEGEVYVTGESLGDGTWADMTTVKYGPDGTQLWAARYNRYGHAWDGANAVVADKGGNAYVTGKSENPFSGTDYMTIKYDPSGNQVWATGHSKTPDDVPVALTLGPSNSIFVTGTVEGYRIGPDIFTIKYVETDEVPGWGVASSALQTTAASTTVRPAGVFAHLLLIFLPVLGITICLRLRHD